MLMLISTGCARQAYGSDVTNDPLVSHQIVARLVVQCRPMHFCVEVGFITACSSRTPSLRRQKAGQISEHMGFQPGLERLTPLLAEA